MSLLEVADIIIQNKILVLLGQQNTETGLAQWYHLAILGLENSYTSGEATSIGI